MDLIYLDNAATTQKPLAVIEAVADFYKNHNANIHSGIHTLSEEASDLYSNARKTVARFINANDSAEVIFTKGCTESLNRVAFAWAEKVLKKGDIVLTTEFEHHSNLLPWQVVCKKTGADLEFLNLENTDSDVLAALKEKMSDKVKVVAISQSSNVLGITFPVKEICKIAHKYGAKVSVDGAQAIPHVKVDVKDLGCDFYSFSSHKMIGPMGIGVLWGKKELLEEMNPYEYGGGIIEDVDKLDFKLTVLPEQFEAGTPNIAAAVGLTEAINYLNTLGMENIQKHETELTKYFLEKLQATPNVTIVGPNHAEGRSGIVSFTVTGIHGHDIAAVLNTKGIAVRAGYHCTMPLHKKLNLAPTVRASFYVYNNFDDADKLIEGIKYAIKILG